MQRASIQETTPSDIIRKKNTKYNNIKNKIEKYNFSILEEVWK